MTNDDKRCEECGRDGHPGENCPYARLEQARRHLRNERTGPMAAMGWEQAAERAQEEIDALESSSADEEIDFSQPPEDNGPDNEPHGGPGAAEWNAAAWKAVDGAEKPPGMPPIARAVAHAISLRPPEKDCGIDVDVYAEPASEPPEELTQATAKAAV